MKINKNKRYYTYKKMLNNATQFETTILSIHQQYSNLLLTPTIHKKIKDLLEQVKRLHIKIHSFSLDYVS